MEHQQTSIGEIERVAPFSRGSTECFLTGHWSARKPVWAEKTSPCRQACPIGNDIARAFAYASKGAIDEALAAFRRENPLPGVCGRVCYHPCEGECNRKELEEGAKDVYGEGRVTCTYRRRRFRLTDRAFSTSFSTENVENM